MKLRSTLSGLFLALALGTSAHAETIDGKTFLDAVGRYYKSKKDPRAAQIANMQALLVAMKTSTLFEIPEAKKTDFKRMLEKADDFTSEKVAEYAGLVVGKLLGKTLGGVVGGLLSATSTSLCADLPSCTGAVKRDCAVRFVLDSDVAAFKRFVAQPGCAQRLFDALQGD